MYGAWHPDPSGRFDLRWHDGRQWTQFVTQGGWSGTDSPPPPAPGTAPLQLTQSPPSGTNGMAIAAFVLAVTGAVVGIMPPHFFEALAGGVLGLIFGWIGFERTKQTSDTRGRRLAVAGIALSIVALALGIRGTIETVSDIESWANNIDDVAFEEFVIPSGPVAEPTAYAITPGLCTNAGAPTYPAHFDGTLRNATTAPRAYRIIVEFVDATGVVADRASSRTPLLEPGQSANWIASGSRRITGEITCRISVVRFERS